MDIWLARCASRHQAKSRVTTTTFPVISIFRLGYFVTLVDVICPGWTYSCLTRHPSCVTNKALISSALLKSYNIYNLTLTRSTFYVITLLFFAITHKTYTEKPIALYLGLTVAVYDISIKFYSNNFKRNVKIQETNITPGGRQRPVYRARSSHLPHQGIYEESSAFLGALWATFIQIFSKNVKI